MVLDQFGLGERNFFFVEELAEVLKDYVVNFEALRDFVSDDVMLGEVEKCVVLKERVLEFVGLDLRQLYVWRNAATAINRASAIRELDFVVGEIFFLVTRVIV